MPADMYSDAGPEAPAAAPEQEPAVPKEEQETAAEPVQIPKASLGGMDPKVGDVCDFKIIKVMEDSVLAEYVTDESEGEHSEPESGGEDNPGGMRGMMY